MSGKNVLHKAGRLSKWSSNILSDSAQVCNINDLEKTLRISIAKVNDVIAPLCVLRCSSELQAFWRSASIAASLSNPFKVCSLSACSGSATCFLAYSGGFTWILYLFSRVLCLSFLPLREALASQHNSMFAFIPWWQTFVVLFEKFANMAYINSVTLQMSANISSIKNSIQCTLKSKFPQQFLNQCAISGLTALKCPIQTGDQYKYRFCIYYSTGCPARL